MSHWYLYLVRCHDGSLYTGIATDVARRIFEHQGHGEKGAKYLRGRGPLQLVFHAPIGSRSLALRLERKVKRLPKARKEKLIMVKGYFRKLKGKWLISSFLLWTSCLPWGMGQEKTNVLKPHQGPGRYPVEIKHATAGEKGSFFMIVWVDEYGDGVPDKEISRSKRKVAATAGEWSKWKFQNSAKVYYVGNCWDQKDEQI